MSHRSAKWIALAFSGVLIVLFGVVLLRSLPSGTAGAQAPAGQSIDSNLLQENDGPVWVDDDAVTDGEWYDDSDHDSDDDLYDDDYDSDDDRHADGDHDSDDDHDDEHDDDH